MKIKSKKATAFAIILALCLSVLPASLLVPARAAADNITLQDFLEQLGITFGEYLALVAEFEEADIYPHYLEQNAGRYSAFQRDNPDIAVSTAIAYVNVNIDLGLYNDILEVPASQLAGVTMLVNKNFALPENWTADDMVDIGAGFMVREEAAGYLVSLRDTMREAGMRMFPVSTYRAYASSLRLYNDALSRWGRETADLNWARAGHSEHQTGLAADILQRTDSPTLTEARFETTDEYAWLLDNAHEYGFILRYPKEYEDIHGYKFEPWHWRYVGRDIAAAMYNEKIPVYEEFYGKYLAPEVLVNIRDLVFEQRALAEAQEQERIERELAEQQAALEAKQAEEEARAAEEARKAHEAAVAEALQREAEEHAALMRQQALEQAEKDRTTTYNISLALTGAIFLTAAGMYIIDRRKRGRKA